jgi:GntR family transcriptional repressor for pyruvate dehydrogenase complex
MFRNRMTRDQLLDQHRAINSALQARDGAAARTAVVQHMDYVRQSMTDQSRATRNEEIARQRLEHERSR